MATINPMHANYQVITLSHTTLLWTSEQKQWKGKMNAKKIEMKMKNGM